MKLSLYQFNPKWEDIKSNQQRIISTLDKANLNTDVLIFPELTQTGFTMRSKKFSETVGGETSQFFQSIALKYHIHVFSGFIENLNQKYYNSLVHVNRQGNIQTKYHKVHPFSFSGEDRHFFPGENPVIAKVDNVEVGLSICYDLRFPELYRYYGKSRVSLIINIANWPVQRIEHWHTLLKARSIENLCYIVGVNRTGKDKGNSYNGQSAIYDPLGKNILKFGKAEKIETVELNLDLVKQARQKFPFLEDIRLI